MKKIHRLLLIGILFFCFACSTPSDESPVSGDVPPIPTPGKVTLVELGASWCPPCQQMAPIIADLQKEYAGRVSIITIDLDKHRDQADRFGVRGIPTFILYDQNGRQAGRSAGFMEKKEIVDAFAQLGVPPGAKTP